MQDFVHQPKDTERGPNLENYQYSEPTATSRTGWSMVRANEFCSFLLRAMRVGFSYSLLRNYFLVLII